MRFRWRRCLSNFKVDTWFFNGNNENTFSNRALAGATDLVRISKIELESLKQQADVGVGGAGVVVAVFLQLESASPSGKISCSD